MVFAAPTVDNYPQNAILENISGGTFTLHHEITYNQSQSGFYIISVNWEYVNPNTGLPDNNYNFTLDNYMAYWDNSDPMECTLSNDIDNGSLHSQVFQNLNPEGMNGSFNVDIRYLLKGPDGTLHIVWDNHPFHYTSIMYAEASTLYAYPDDVTIKVDAATKGVNVSISPSYQSGVNGEALTYTVTVVNTGNISDDYSLTVTDNAGWSLGVLPMSLLNVSPRNSGTATLSVTVPSSAVGGTIDNITVTATSQTNNTVRNSVTCTATATKAAAPSGGVSPLVYVGVAVVIVVIIAAVLILKPF